MNPFPPDIVERLRTDYPQEPLSGLMLLLDEYRGTDRDRIIRCVLHLARADTQKLLHYLGAATLDFRDVIYWAEYQRDGSQVHDFSQPFAA